MVKGERHKDLLSFSSFLCFFFLSLTIFGITMLAIGNALSAYSGSLSFLFSSPYLSRMNEKVVICILAFVNTQCSQLGMD